MSPGFTVYFIWLAVLVLVCTVSVFRADDQAVQRTERVTPPQAAASTSASAAPVPVGPDVSAAARHADREAAPSPARRHRSDLAAKFEASTDLRAFVAEARSRPSAGGVFYALRALAECRQQPEPGSTEPFAEPSGESADAALLSHAQLHRRGERLDRAARRCAAFMDSELSDEAVARIETEATGRDPLLRAYQGWLKAVEAVDYRRMTASMAKVLAFDEPLLIEWVGMTGADYLGNAGSPPGTPDDAARRRAIDAWRLLPCALGADCQRGDLQTDAACEVSGRCAADRWEAVLRSGGWQSEEDRRALALEVTRLAHAVHDRDAKAVLGLTAQR